MFEDIKSRILSYGNKRNKLVSILGIRKTFNTKTSASDTFRADPLCDDIMAATSYLPDRCGVPFRIKCIFSGITHAPKCPVCGKDCAPIDSDLSAKYACFMKTCGDRSCKAKHAASFIEMTPEILRAHAEAQIKHKDRVRESYRRFASLYASGEFKRLPKANIVSFCENLILRRNRNGKIVRERDFVENVDMLCSIVLETVHMIPIVIDASHNRIDMSEFRFNERIYCIVNSIDTVPVCKYCGGEVRFDGMSNGYSASCPACGVDKCRERKGHMTKPQILACIDTTKYEIVNFPIKSGDYLVIKCKRCGYVSKWWTGNGFLQALTHKDLCKNCEVFDSEAEHEVAEFIRNECGYDVLRNDRSVISPQELDVFVPDRKVAIEFDGFYYHSDDRIGRGYHLFKTNRCNDIGVSLIHVFESEWVSRRDSVKREISLALGHAIEYTRCDCKSRIAEIQQYEYDELARSASVGMLVTDDNCKYYGLFYENELVAGMVAFNRYRHEYDVSGVCVKIGWDIDETAGNMLRLFEGSSNMTRIRLFVDRRFPTHSFVKGLGYDFAYNTKTRGWWFSCKDHRHRFNMTYDDGTQEMSEKMTSNGYKRIFDCGNAVFIKSYSRK